MTHRDKKNIKKLPILPLKITKPNAQVTQIVNDFVDRFYKHEYRVSLDAVYIPVTADVGLTGRQSGNLAQFLFNAIENYIITKDKPKDNAKWACFLFSLITHAYGTNIVDTGDAAKVKKCEEENKRLKDVQIELEAKILKLKEENENLHKALGIFEARSDVTTNTEK